ncbi:Fe-S cluster assembly protein SufB, partial [Vibrio sp. 10N.222.48.A4]
MRPDAETRPEIDTQPEVTELLHSSHYREGFYTELSSDTLSKGINEQVVRAISKKRNEPEWMLEF